MDAIHPVVVRFVCRIRRQPVNQQILRRPAIAEAGPQIGLEVDLRTGFRNRRSPEYLLIHGLPPDAANESHDDWVNRIHPQDREATEKKLRDARADKTRGYSAQ